MIKHKGHCFSSFQQQWVQYKHIIEKRLILTKKEIQTG